MGSIGRNCKTVKCQGLLGTIAKNGNATHEIDLATMPMTLGKASLHLIFASATGTIKVETFYSNEDDPSNWVEDSGGDELAAGATQGTKLIDITPSVYARWQRIKITEGNVASISVTLAEASYM